MKQIIIAAAALAISYSRHIGVNLGATEKEQFITLPDGSRQERFMMDGNTKRELVLVVADNDHGCRLTYRDAMTADDKEFTGNFAAAAVKASAAKAVKSLAELKEKTETAHVWTDADSKSDIMEELDKRKIKYDAKDKKEALLELLK